MFSLLSTLIAMGSAFNAPLSATPTTSPAPINSSVANSFDPMEIDNITMPQGTKHNLCEVYQATQIGTRKRARVGVRAVPAAQMVAEERRDRKIMRECRAILDSSPEHTALVSTAFKASSMRALFFRHTPNPTSFDFDIMSSDRPNRLPIRARFTSGSRPWQLPVEEVMIDAPEAVLPVEEVMIDAPEAAVNVVTLPLPSPAVEEPMTDAPPESISSPISPNSPTLCNNSDSSSTALSSDNSTPSIWSTLASTSTTTTSASDSSQFQPSNNCPEGEDDGTSLFIPEIRQVVGGNKHRSLKPWMNGSLHDALKDVLRTTQPPKRGAARQAAKPSGITKRSTGVAKKQKAKTNNHLSSKKKCLFEEETDSEDEQEKGQEKENEQEEEQKEVVQPDAISSQVETFLSEISPAPTATQLSRTPTALTLRPPPTARFPSWSKNSKNTVIAGASNGPKKSKGATTASASDGVKKSKKVSKLRPSQIHKPVSNFVKQLFARVAAKAAADSGETYVEEPLIDYYDGM
ncbi:hypothetical protein D6C90_05229 [Aureobasidium pullulans]|uniref:Uncharacterized protein n=1 Tax=Aureobasidium pullulans TaxID=5580 RepID=A0A4S9EC93_AURPU|nr:hypothetical protein D6D11_10484 [Aureobasidium pullulans]THX29974.1 hypothetical protein D6D12_03795 [Aureobasidium pullulans]THZ42693.1 hypothetical protein D6C90_05229 [Aureobasidium pullulans]